MPKQKVKITEALKAAKRHKAGKRNLPLGFIHPYIFSYSDHSRPKAAKSIGYTNTKLDLYLINTKATNRPKKWKSTPTNRFFKKHFDRTGTFYYSNAYRKQSYILGMVDIDIHNKGATEGAILFSDHLKTLFPDMYFEKSTSGKSLHGYMWVNTEEMDIFEVRESFKNFEKYLQHEARKSNANIETVEFKGKPGQEHCYDKYGQLIESSFGDLCKLPFAYETEDTAEELNNSTRVSAEYLMNLSVPSSQPTAPAKAKSKAKGSCNNEFAPPSDFALKLTQWLPKVEKLFGNEYVYQDGEKERRISTLRWAETLLVLNYMLENRKTDESKDNSAINRIEKLWKEFVNAGLVKSKWHRGVFCYMKNELSRMGFIRWVEHKYSYEDQRPGKKNGYANIFYISDELVSQLDSEHDCEMQGSETHQTPVCWDYVNDCANLKGRRFKTFSRQIVASKTSLLSTITEDWYFPNFDPTPDEQEAIDFFAGIDDEVKIRPVTFSKYEKEDYSKQMIRNALLFA